MSEALAPPPPTPAPPEGEGRPAPKTPKTPKKVELPKEITVGLASAKQRIEHQKQSGQKVEEMEVMEERKIEMARLKMTEDRSKWEGRYGFVKGMISRFWKFSVGEVATFSKEERHATRILAESGVQMTTLPNDFLEKVDDLARQNVAARRSGIRRRIWGEVRDIFHEATFTEKELHQERINIVKTLRQVAENPTDPNLQPFITNNPSLIQDFSRVLTGDYQASEALAKRVNNQFGNELIHGVVGEKATTTAEELKGPVADFFKQQIIAPLLKEGLAGGGIRETTLSNARRSMQEFFFSKRFIDWYNDPANQAIKDKLNLSLSYGSDLIPLIQETLLPQLQQAQEHMVSAINVDNYIQEMVLKVKAGTVEAGQKGVINKGLAERMATRTITNQRVHEIYRNLQRQNNAPKLVPDTYLEASVNRANLLGQLYRVGSNPVIGGLVVAGGLYLATSGLKWAGKAAIPWIGGSAVGGALRAMQERRAFTREFEEYGVESELGYKNPHGAPRREQMRRLEFHKLEMESALTQPMKRWNEQIEKGQDLQAANITELMGLIANTQARLGLMDREGFGLLSARHPQFYQIDRTNLELTKAQASALLKGFLASHPNRLNEVQQQLGMQNTLPDAMIDQLVQAQENFLYRGVGLNPNFQNAFGTLNQDSQGRPIESIESRARAFQRARNIRTATAFAGTFAAGLAGGLISQEAMTEFHRLRGEPVANSVLENVFSGKSPDHWLDSGRAPGFAQDSLKELKASAGDREISPGILLHSDGNNHYEFLDTNTRTPFVTPPIRLEDDNNGPRIVFLGKLNDIPQPVKDTLSQKGWIPPHEFSDADPSTLYHENAIDLFNNGGQHEVAHGIFLKASGMESGYRLADIVDAAGNKIIENPVSIDSNGQILLNESYDKLPANLRGIFSNWQLKPENGLKVPGFNLDKIQDFFKNPVTYGGRLGVSKDLFLQTSPELENGNRPVRFFQLPIPGAVDQAAVVVGPPMWHTPDGRIIVGGDPSQFPPAARNFLDSLDSKPTTEHNLRYWLKQLVDQGTPNKSPEELKRVADEVAKHGNFLLNSDDIKESSWRNPENLPPSDWFAKKVAEGDTSLIDPRTGKPYIAMMSYTLKPIGRQINSFLDLDGRFHVYPDFNIRGEGNTTITPDQWNETFKVMRNEGWKADKTQWGWLVTPPEAFEYKPASTTGILPPDIPYHVDAYPPPPPIIDQEAMIPIPWEYRKPLESPTTPERPRWYPDGGFKPGSRIWQYLKRTSPVEARNTPSGEDEVEGKKATLEAKEAFSRTDEIYIVMSPYAIGDSVVAIAYVRAIESALEKSGKSTRINLVVNENNAALFEGLKSSRINLILSPGDMGLDRAKTAVATSNASNPLIVDFESYPPINPYITREQINGKDTTTIGNILRLALEGYANSSDGQERIAKFIEDLFMLKEGTVDPNKAQLHLTLPDGRNSIYGGKTKAEVYQNLANKFNIDITKPQISIVIGGSWASKRYSLNNWAEVIKEISSKYPGYQFNVLRSQEYTTDQIETVLKAKGVDNSCKIIDASLLEAAILFEHQEAVISNDTGLGHIAAAIKNGPPVVTIHTPKTAPSPNIWAVSRRQYPVEMSDQEKDSLGFESQDEENEESKHINKIPPNRVVEKVLKVI